MDSDDDFDEDQYAILDSLVEQHRNSFLQPGAVLTEVGTNPEVDAPLGRECCTLHTRESTTRPSRSLEQHKNNTRLSPNCGIDAAHLHV